MIEMDSDHMGIGQYTVRIPGGRMYRTGSGYWYCALKDGQQFSLEFSGPRNTRARCEIFIQNQPMHLNADHSRRLVLNFDGEPCILYRPLHEDRSFQFFATNSEMGKKLGIPQMDRNIRGLVKVIIYPEIVEEAWSEPVATRSVRSGAVALSGPTGQTFKHAARIQKTGEPIVFTFRLVEEDLPSQPTLIGGYPPPVD